MECDEIQIGQERESDLFMNTITLGTFHNLIDSFEKRGNSTILIETTKPIMAAEPFGNVVAIVYLMQDKVVRHEGETVNNIFQEFFVATVDAVYFSKFMNNEITLLALIEYSENKSRIVKFNSKIYERQSIPEETLTTEMKAKLFPDSGVYLKDMPTPT